jgi:hypothetical protein
MNWCFGSEIEVCVCFQIVLIPTNGYFDIIENFVRLYLLSLEKINLTSRDATAAYTSFL